MNIGTGIVVVGVIVVGYWMFARNQSAVTPKGEGIAKATEQTIVAGTDLARTIKELSDLNSAVLSSVGIFNTPSFRELKDFSVEVPAEPLGRDNPFVPTEWKTKLAK